MKNFYLILIAIMAFTFTAKAQFSPYLADGYLEEARDKAAESISDPYLVSIATINGTIEGLEFGGELIPLEFILEGDDKGKGSAWAYTFMAEESDPVVILVGDLGPLGLQKFNTEDLGVDTGLLTGYASDNSLDDTEWINSDEMVNYLLASQEYQDYMSANENGAPRGVSLGYAEYGILETDKPYWFVLMTVEEEQGGVIQAESDSLLIVIDAEDGSITDVEDDDRAIGNLEIYPNPASSQAIISVPSYFSLDGAEVTMFDINGGVVDSFVPKTRKLELNLNEYVPGVYYVRIQSKEGTLTKPIVINK